MMGASMNNELENQRHQLDRVQDRADENRDRISKLNRIRSIQETVSFSNKNSMIK